MSHLPETFEQWWALNSNALLTCAANGWVFEAKKLAADCWSAGLSVLEVELADGSSEIFKDVSPRIQKLYHFSHQVKS